MPLTVKSQQLVQRYQQLEKEMNASGVSMLAVSKYAPDEAVQVLVDAGQVQFAESRPQNLRDRANRWPACAWHMIGPVQKNKAKYIARHAAMWHSCDNLETARAVARHVTGKILPVLIQINIGNAPGQSGVSPDAAPALLEALIDMQGLQPVGLMCMAPRGGDVVQAFRVVRSLRDTLFSGSLPASAKTELSMGMSNDYRLAVQEGSTMVRLGSILFGEWDNRK
ncbi:MAG: YggS family pyridoxal phosphate-dependent enzyme [Mariprofundus sp.]|nr:YggS family pyridoxal phosphate-dependent enzyme [Mariprofundus sp.]